MLQIIGTALQHGIAVLPRTSKITQTNLPTSSNPIPINSAPDVPQLSPVSPAVDKIQFRNWAGLWVDGTRLGALPTSQECQHPMMTHKLKPQHLVLTHPEQRYKSRRDAYALMVLLGVALRPLTDPNTAICLPACWYDFPLEPTTHPLMCICILIY